jgi:hypothetical protein
MIQEIVVYMLIIAAILYVGYSLYRVFRPKQKNLGHCAGCSSSSCGIQELKSK